MWMCEFSAGWVCEKGEGTPTNERRRVGLVQELLDIQGCRVAAAQVVSRTANRFSRSPLQNNKIAKQQKKKKKKQIAELRPTADGYPCF